MEMEVIRPSPPVELNIESGCTSPYISAPSSPPRFNGTRTPFFSAPASPTRSSAFYNEFNSFPNGGATTAAAAASLSAVPFNWEEKPGIPKTAQFNCAHHQSNDDDDDDHDDDTDFAFDFSGQLEKSSLPADELFDGGKIKPLKPPPRFEYESRPLDTPKSPRSPKKIFKQAFSPRQKSRDFDPFAAALENTRLENNMIKEPANDHHQRGRERRSHNNPSTSSSSSPRQKGSRSLSPFRVSDLLFDQEKAKKSSAQSSSSSTSTSSSTSSAFSPSSWYRKWKLKDLLLFRSASEGRAASKAHQYAMLKKTNQEDDVKNASFRSTDSVGSVSSRRRSGPSISAHELHYTMNRAASEEMKRKTFLPYKQGLLGCLGFNPAANEISRGLASLNRA